MGNAMNTHQQLDDGVTGHDDNDTNGTVAAPNTSVTGPTADKQQPPGNDTLQSQPVTNDASRLTIPAELSIGQHAPLMTLRFQDGSVMHVNIDQQQYRAIQQSAQQTLAADSKQQNDIAIPIKKVEPAASVTPTKQRYTIVHHVKKYKGQGAKATPYIDLHAGAWAFIASFIGIGVVALINYNAFDANLGSHYQDLYPSFGASAVLLYGAIQSDLAQPRAVIGGHVVSAFVGVCIQQIFAAAGEQTNVQLLFIQCALAVSLAITAMNVTRTLHPPGGATALIAVMPSPTVQSFNWLFIGWVCLGATIMVLVALVMNNIPRKRHWPKTWGLHL